MSNEIVIADNKELAKAQEQACQPSMLQAVMAAAMNPDLDPDRLERFLAMARELDQEQKKQEFNVAFAGAYNVISKIKIAKNGEIHYPGKNGGQGSVIKFIKHDDLSRLIKPVLTDHGLVATYDSEVILAPPKTVVVMEIMHANGYSKKWRSIPLPMVDSGGGKNDLQGSGSTSAYGRRYVIIPAFDIVAEGADDDGNKGKASVAITEDQAIKIDEILAALEHKYSGRRAQFMTWVKAQFKFDKITDIQQGDQLEEVMAKLDSVQKRDGLKK